MAGGKSWARRTSRRGAPAVAPTKLAHIRLLGFCASRGFLRELETNFSVIEFQIRRERSSTFRDEAFEKTGFSGGEKLLRLFFRNLAPEDRFAELEFARLSIGL